GQAWLDGGTWVPTLRRGSDDWAAVLETAGRLWVSGLPIDWTRWEPGRGRRKIAGLPTYPWEVERHWVDVAKRRESLTAEHVREIDAPPGADWLYEVVWQASPLQGEIGAAKIVATPSVIAAKLSPEVPVVAAKAGVAVNAQLLPMLERLSFE